MLSSSCLASTGSSASPAAWLLEWVASQSYSVLALHVLCLLATHKGIHVEPGFPSTLTAVFIIKLIHSSAAVGYMTLYQNFNKMPLDNRVKHKWAITTANLARYWQIITFSFFFRKWSRRKSREPTPCCLPQSVGTQMIDTKSLAMPSYAAGCMCKSNKVLTKALTVGMKTNVQRCLCSGFCIKSCVKPSCLWTMYTRIRVLSYFPECMWNVKLTSDCSLGGYVLSLL